MAELIQVTVTSRFQLTTTENKSGWHHKGGHQIENAVETQAHLVLTDPENSLYVAIKKFRNYPEKGRLDVLLSVPRAKYREMEKRKTALQKERVAGLIEGGESEMAGRRVLAGLQDLIQAQGILTGYFGDQAVEVKIAGRAKEAQSLLAAKISAALESIALIPHPDRVTYSVEGKVNQAPQIEAVYKDPKSGERMPVGGLKLKAAFVQGDGELGTAGMLTDSRGMAQLPLLSAAPDKAQSTIEVTADEKALLGDGATRRNLSLPQCVIELRKARSVACAVYASGAGMRSNLLGAAKRAVIAQGFSFVPMPGRRSGFSEAETRRAAETHADYFLAITVKDGSDKVGDYDLYKGWAKSEIAFYALPNGEPVFDVEGPGGAGSGTSAGGAEGKAVAKVMPRLGKLLRDRLVGVK